MGRTGIYVQFFDEPRFSVDIKNYKSMKVKTLLSELSSLPKFRAMFGPDPSVCILAAYDANERHYIGVKVGTKLIDLQLAQDSEKWPFKVSFRYHFYGDKWLKIPCLQYKDHKNASTAPSVSPEKKKNSGDTPTRGEGEADEDKPIEVRENQLNQRVTNMNRFKMIV